MSRKLRFYRNKHKLCCSTFRNNLLSHSHSENNLKNELLDNPLRPQFAEALLEKELYSFLYFQTVPRANCTVIRISQLVQTGISASSRSESTLRKSQKNLTRSNNFQQRRLGSFTIIKRITKAIFQIQGIKNPANAKTVHRKHLVEYYPKEGSLPAMIEKSVPPDHQNDDFYERFMEQRAPDLTNPSTSDEIYFFPFLIEPLQSIHLKIKGNEFIRWVTIRSLTLHSLLFDHLRYYLQLPLKNQSPIYLPHSNPKLLSRHLLDPLAQFNNLFVILPNYVPKSPNKSLTTESPRLSISIEKHYPTGL